MLVTGIILIGIVFYAIWAVRKIHKNRKNGSCCSGSCSGCVGKEYCSDVRI
ncbi:FeoB-associated Cys-rich membrane protein [Blautia wexlerae]|uniref:FeoB-associated Cys-rich membrane protein n=1 Tax=Blautia wexlerae TaxID=418240 RepID=UPI0034A1AEBF